MVGACACVSFVNKSSKFLSTLYTIYSAQVHHTNCTFPVHFCNPTASNLLDRVEDVITSAEDCSKACQADKSCNFFTFFNFRRSPACFALKSCKERKPRCTVPSNCVSGEKDCHNQTVCPKLNLKKKKKKGENAR